MLQFQLKSTNVPQKDHWKVDEYYELSRKLTNHMAEDLVLHQHALPMVIEWPPCYYYKYNGKDLPFPESWASLPDTGGKHFHFNFSKKSEIVPFNPCKKHQRSHHSTLVVYK